MTSSKLHAVLVTYRRPVQLAGTLDVFARQTRQPDTLTIVDNGPSQETAAVVRAAEARFQGRVDYLPMAENVGYTGGARAGMGHVLASASDADWIVVCDDDDPPDSVETFGNVLRLGDEMVAREPRTAGVGLGGGRFDFRRGRLVRVPTSELHGPVPLDYISGGQFGCYRVTAIRDVGPWSEKIFFGFSEGEYGLRLRRAGYVLWGDGDVWRERRIAAGREHHEITPAWRLPPVGWRRYYSLRNVIWILRQHGHRGAALRVSLVNGIGKPLANLPITPLVAVRHLRLNGKAIRDGWTDRMGRRVEPIPWSARPDERVTVPSVLSRLRSS